MNAETPAAPKKKILVVDDNEVILKTVSLKLQGCGYQIFTALDGSEAVAAARKETPDLILLDINFPPEVDGVPWDGFRIMDWFQRLDPSKIKERAASCGAVAFFNKPINHDDLLKVVRATLGGSDPPA
jgi:CheY-like chemotaxis protein